MEKKSIINGALALKGINIKVILLSFRVFVQVKIKEEHIEAMNLHLYRYN